jgi:FAD/FMN-containing dehydrogenase
MGNFGSSPLQTCLLAAVAGDASRVAFPSNPLYQIIAPRAYNLDFPVQPAAVTFPKSSVEVEKIVRCATQGGLKVQARGGGHSYGNYGARKSFLPSPTRLMSDSHEGLGGSDGAIVVDMKHFRDFSIDTVTQVATIGAGTPLQDVTRQLHNAGGRAMAHGTCPSIGIGGHATIGGIGPTSRMWGMALDHILEVEVVLANSTTIRASATKNPDVLFAVKGAGASFGIVTEFKVRTEPEPGSAVQYSYTFNLGNAGSNANLFKEWQSLISEPTLSRKFASVFTVSHNIAVVSGTYFGSKTEFDAFQLEHRFPNSTKSSAVEFTDWQGLVAHWGEKTFLQIITDVPAWFYSKSLSFSPQTLIPASGIDALFQYMMNQNSGTPAWFVIFDLVGGAINDVPTNATAYAHRNSLYWMQSYAATVGSVSQTTINFLDGINQVSSRRPCLELILARTPATSTHAFQTAK